MADEGGAQSGGGGGAGGAGGAGASAIAGGDGGGAGAGAAPEWLGTLPDELKGDATLSRYKSVEELARGHLETKRLASSKLAIPGAEAKPEDWGAVWDALGRPKDASGYDIPIPKGHEEGPMAQAFRPVAHQLGLNSGQAKGLVEFFDAQQNAMKESYLAEGTQQVDALKAEMGAEYEPKLAAARAIAAKLNFPKEFIDAIDQNAGSGALIKGFMKLAELTGEHGRVDGEQLGGFAAGDANAEGQLNTLFADKGWREKFNAGDAATVQQHTRLLAAAKVQAQRAPRI